MRWGDLDRHFCGKVRCDGPGGAFGVFRGGRTLFLRGYGSARLGQVAPLGPRTRFDLASLTKQFTAFCILLLQQRGRLSLEDDFRLHVPGFGLAFAGIKIRHLMHHSSGLLCLLDLRWLDRFAGALTMDRAEFLALMAGQNERNFPAGDEHLYNNDAYVLLAEIVRRRGGMDLPEFAERNIFGPLGMRATAFAPLSGGGGPQGACGHRRRGRAWEIAPVYPCLAGPANLWSTVEDLGQWTRSLCEQSLGPPSLYRAQALAGRVRRPRPLEEGLPYAAGLWWDSVRGRRYLVHTGGVPGFSSVLLWRPSDGLSIIWLRNREEPEGLLASSALRFIDAGGRAGLLDPSARPRRAARARRAAVPGARSRHGTAASALRKASGFYQGLDFPEWWELKAAGARLRLNRGGWWTDLAWKRGRLLVPGLPGRSLSLLAAKGGGWQLQEQQGRRPLRRLAFAGRAGHWVPQARSLAGTYAGATGHSFSLRLKSGRLCYRDAYPQGYPEVPLRWLAPDRLVYSTDSQGALGQLPGNGWFQVRRSPLGAVLGLQFSEPGCDGRNRSLWYERKGAGLRP